MILRPSSSASRASIQTWVDSVKTTPTTPNARKRKRAPSSAASQRSPPTFTRQQSRPESIDPLLSGANMDSTSDDAPLYRCIANSYALPNTLTKYSSSTPSRDACRIKVKLGKDPGFTERRMSEHGRLKNSTNLKKYPEFEAAVNKIIYSDRHSAMRPQSVRNIIDRREYYENRSEDTILRNLIPLIIKEEYLAEVEKYNAGSLAEALEPTPSTETQEGKKYVSKYWFAEGVDIAVNEQFRKTFLPSKTDDEAFDAELAIELKKEDGMTNPKPDYCYGFRHDQFPTPHDIIMDPDLATLVEVTPGQNHSFFLIEGKSNEGNNTDAQNQARRGGATLVNAGRKLHDWIGIEDVTGADDRTFVFSATMAPDAIAIWVHWAEVTSDQTLFHMNNLTRKFLDDPDDLEKLRIILHNILDWGCHGRLERLEKLHQNLHVWQRGEMVKRKKKECILEEEKRNKKRIDQGRKRLRIE